MLRGIWDNGNSSLSWLPLHIKYNLFLSTCALIQNLFIILENTIKVEINAKSIYFEQIL